MAEGIYSRVKRNVGRAFDFSGSEDIRRNRDEQEYNSNMDYMLSRGKKRTPQDQSNVPAGERSIKSHTPIVPEGGTIDKLRNMRKKVTDTIQGQPMSSNSGNNRGVASNAVTIGAMNTPAVRLFKNLRKKKGGDREVGEPRDNESMEHERV